VIVPVLLLLVARDLLLHDPPRVLAWRLLHDESLATLPGWLAFLLPRTPAGFDSDPIAMLLAGFAAALAAVYLGLVVAGAAARTRLAVIVLGAFLLVVAPSAAFIGMGLATDRPYGQDGGVVQLPLALEKILAGQSPYGADYSDSVLGRQARSSAFWEPFGGNPILRHHAYLPGTHAVFMPFYLAFAKGLGLFDPRFVTLLAYGLVMLLVGRLVEEESHRLAALAVVAFNPLVYWHQIFGANDLVFVLFLLASVLAALGGKAVLAGVALGFACGTKQLAWPFAPFLLLYLSKASSWRDLTRKETLAALWKPAAAAALTFVVVVAPVAALDPAAFYGDIVAYNVGLPGADNYPLGGTPGFGVANLLIYFGQVASLRDYFPFGVFYVLLVPLGLGLVGRQLREPSLGTALLHGGVALLASLYFSRVVHANYLVPLAVLLPLACLLRRRMADAAVVPLFLLTIAVLVVENAVFRPTWDQAVAAGYPKVVGPGFRWLLPHAGPSLTADPIGLLVAGVAAGLAVAYLVAAALDAREAVRAGIGVLAFLLVVVAPTVLMIDVSQRTGIRGQDPWVVQVPADGERLGRGQSPYREPMPTTPEGRQASSTSFRLEPPAVLAPARPDVPPGGASLGAGLRLLGRPDPRWLTLTALTALIALLWWRGSAVGAATAVGMLVSMAPIAFGSVFGSRHILSAALVGAAFLAARGSALVTGLLAGTAAAVDPLVLPILPFVGFEVGEEKHVRRAVLGAGVAALLLVLPPLVLSPAGFLGALVRPPATAMGLGLTDIALYIGLDGPWLGRGAQVALLAVLALATVALLGRRAGVSGALAGSLVALLAIVLAPGLSPEAVALPMTLGLVAALPTDRR